MDATVSALILLLLIAIVIVFLTQGAVQPPKAADSEMLFRNSGLVDTYRFDESAVHALQTTSSLRAHMLADTSYPRNSDVCILLFDGTSPVDLTENVAVVGTNTCDHDNPCIDGRYASVHSKPVLKDGRILKLDIIICR